MLPVISKLFEKIIYDQIYPYFDSNNILSNNQYGFRRLHSTEFAVLEILDRITEALDQGHTAFVFYLDLSKAFDSLNHSILLGKLKYYGLTNSALSLFSSYLSNRKQYVEIDHCKYFVFFSTVGVSQGSILGPLLFVIYLNDFFNSSQFFDLVAYADDITLINTNDLNCCSDMSQLFNAELHKIHQWLCINKLSLNLQKSKFMIFRNPSKVINSLPKISINNVLIECVSHFDLLGISISQTLNYKYHIDKIIMKTSRCLGMLCKLKHFLPFYILKTLYNSLLLPHFTYGILAWGTNTNQIFKIQKKAIRIITNSKYNAHTNPLFKSLNLLKIQDIYNLNVLKFYFNYRHNLLPRYFNSYNFKYRSSIHEHHTRSKNEIQVNKTRTNIGGKSLRHITPKIINNTSSNIINKIHTHSYIGYINYIKYFIIDSYIAECNQPNCYVCNIQL